MYGLYPSGYVSIYKCTVLNVQWLIYYQSAFLQNTLPLHIMLYIVVRETHPLSVYWIVACQLRGKIKIYVIYVLAFNRPPTKSSTGDKRERKDKRETQSL